MLSAVRHVRQLACLTEDEALRMGIVSHRRAICDAKAYQPARSRLTAHFMTSQMEITGETGCRSGVKLLVCRGEG